MNTEEEITQEELTKERLVSALKKTAEIVMETARSMQKPTKPKKSWVIKRDINLLILKLYEMEKIAKSYENKDAYNYCITELNMILKDN